MRSMKKILSLIVIFMMLISNSAVIFAEQQKPGPVAAPGSGATGADKFESAIAAAVQEVFAEQADTLGPDVLQMVTPQIDALKSSLEACINNQKAMLDNLSTGPANIMQNLSAIPPESQMAQIPPQFLEEAKANAQSKAKESIDMEFVSTEAMIKEQISKLMQQALPQIRLAVKPAMQNLIFSINNSIEDRITKSIDAKIISVLPEAMTLIPENMAKLTPQQIADKLENKLRPGIESAVRPVMEEKLKAAIEQTISEKVEKPITEKMTPKILDLETEAYDSNVALIPAYVEKLVPKDFIKSVVHENVEKLKAALPKMIAAEQTAMKTAIKQDVDKEIDGIVKVYISGKRYTVDIKTKMIKNVLEIQFDSLAAMLNAKVQYNYAKKQVTLTKDKKTVVLTLNSNIALVNGKKVQVSTPAILDGKQPILPAEIVSELLGYKFEWQPDWKMAVVVK